MSGTPPPPRQLALIVSVGASDIKYWRVEVNARGDKITREERLPNKLAANHNRTHADERASGSADVSFAAPSPRSTNLRAVHQLLMDDRTAWRFATCEDAKVVLSRGEWRASDCPLAEQLGMRDSLHDERGRLLLSPAKVAEIAQALAKLREQFVVVDVAVIHTDRTASASQSPSNAAPPMPEITQPAAPKTAPGTPPRQSYPDEPIASGPLILEYLRNTLGVGDNDPDDLINAITDGGRLEGSQADGADFPVRRAVAHALDTGVAAFVERLKRKHSGNIQNVIPVLLTTGGMAPVKDLLRSIAALRFHCAPRDLSTPELDKTEPRQLILSRLDAATPVISRHEAIDARARALYLVRRGDFPGAWAAVSQFQGSEADHWWLQPLHEVARYFGAAPSAHMERAPTHRDPAIAARVFDALNTNRLDHGKAIDRHKAFALNVAFRLEAALQGDDDSERRFADALSAVCTLIDTLVVTRARQLLEDLGPDGKQLRGLLGVELPKPAADKVPEPAKPFDGIRDKRIYSGRHHWFRLPPANGEKTTWFDVIQALDNALERDPQTRKEVERHLRSLRNNSAHRALAPADIDRIRELGEAHRIWRYQTAQLGHHALAPADPQRDWPGLVHAALCSVGIHDAAEQYRKLVDGLIEVLQCVEPAPAAAHHTAAATA